MSIDPLSKTYTIYCDKCRVRHWVGQGDYLYPTALPFLLEHLGHPLRFAVDGRETDNGFSCYKEAPANEPE